jgi:predicted dehydrogenase
MKMGQKIKLALIGCGKIAGERKHIDAICKNSSLIELAYTCDKVIERAREKAEAYKRVIKEEISRFARNDSERVRNDTPPSAIPVQTGSHSLINTMIPEQVENDKKEVKAVAYYREILDDNSVDACVIATDSGSHSKIALDCLKAHKSVLVEKPMALSILEADEMIKIANESHLKLAVSLQNRFNPLIQALRRKIDEGSFGKIFYGSVRVRWNRNESYYREAPWRGTWERDGGVLMNQCIHSIDLLQWMLGGEMESVYGILGNMNHPYIEAEDFGAAIVKFKNGSIGLIEGTSNIYPKNLEESLSIFGEKGSVVISGPNLNKIEVWEFEDCGKPPEITESSLGHIPIYKDFAESIILDRIPYIDGREGKKSLELVLGIYKSFKERREVKFPLYDFSTKNMEGSL